MEEWLLRNTIGRLQDHFNMNLLQFRLGQTGLHARVSRIVEGFCLLMFLEKWEKDLCVKSNVDLLDT